MYTMAVLNYEGELVPTNKAESARLLSLVDSQRQPRAAESLGLMNLLGDGVPVDIPAGLSHLETAVANGRAQSASTLGRIYLYGVAVPKDRAARRTASPAWSGRVCRPMVKAPACRPGSKLLLTP